MLFPHLLHWSILLTLNLCLAIQNGALSVFEFLEPVHISGHQLSEMNILQE